MPKLRPGDYIDAWKAISIYFTPAKSGGFQGWKHFFLQKLEILIVNFRAPISNHDDVLFETIVARYERR